MSDNNISMEQEETIAAISTPAGEGGVGMVRLSGITAVGIAKELYRSAKGNVRTRFESRRVYYGYVVDDAGARIDEVMLTVMLSPKTYTREDIVEITCHGGPRVTRRILDRALELGARIAEPGEFSKRAFLNGRIDLVQAEAIIDIIKSKSDKGWKTAFSQLDGKLSETLAKIENDLVSIMVDLETSIDFPDDEIEIAADDAIKKNLSGLREKIARLIHSYDTGRIYREGVSVAIIGRPNVGKSSLMNALLERERVIVTPHPGTTRDTVEEALQIEGIAARIVDTAGVREADDPAERMGVERTLQAAKNADIVLLILDGSEQAAEEDIKLAETLGADDSSFALVPVVNKCDKEQKLDVGAVAIDMNGAVKLSAKTGEGVAELKQKIADEITQKGEPLGDGQVLTRERHIEQLKTMTASIDRAMTALDEGLSREFIAADLACAKEALEHLTGKAFDEQVLDRIFSEFCIGK